MFEINLVPEIQKQKQALTKRNATATVTAVVILSVSVLTLVILGSLKVAANVSLNNTNQDIESVKAESAQYKELEEAVISLENGLTAIKNTLNGENNWTILLPHLEAATPNDVSYKSLSIEGNTLTASLSGERVESIARFVESYKGYKVLVLSGTGEPQQQIKLNMDSKEFSTTTRSDGTWIYSMKVNPEKDFSIIISGATNGEVKYSQITDTLSSNEGSITTGIMNLFGSVETKQYTKNGDGVVFDATFTVATEALW